jgi:serine/threonine protein kinase
VIGSSISHYKVRSKLGEGGMGEVWRAEDTKLGRDVALKMLPESFAADPERLGRFEQEARVLASLSHPNIAGIHQLEEVEGKRFLVMEVAEGETLSERIARGPLPVEEAVGIAKQIAEALEAAHEKGIVHRDLKPGNVMVTAEGGVKVLDFGLAKAMGVHPLSGSSGQEFTQSPTLAPGMTQAGMLLGTAGYMSPEQARGRAVDRRADIWAFGCVLFEMLGGRRAFDGETVTDVLGAIVHKEPEIGKLPAEVPGRIRELIGKCLQKDASRRLQSIGDARVALQEWLEHPEESAALAPPRAPAWRRVLPWGVAAAVGVVAVLQAFDLLGPRAPAEPIRRSQVQVSNPPLDSSIGSCLALSPDGRNLVYVTGSSARKALHLRPLDRFDATEIASGDYPDQPYHPFFSPDGEWLGYVTAREMKKVPVAGGAPVTLCPVNLSRGASWGLDGQIVFAPSQSSGLFLLSAAGGEPKPLTTLDKAKGEVSHRWPQWLPGGRAVLFTSGTGKVSDWSDATIEVVDVRTGQRKVLHRGGTQARYVSTGHVVFFHQGTLFALPFDAKTLEVRGSQFPVVEGVAGRPGHGGADFDVSEGGLLAYVAGGQGANPYRMVSVDRNGHVEPLWDEPGLYGTPRLSPDGKRLAATVLRDGNFDVWVFDLERTVATRLTFKDGYEGDEVWSPDGRYLAFASDRDGAIKIYRKRADGSGEAELLTDCKDEEHQCFPASWSPDGRTLAVTTSRSDIWMVPLAGGGEPKPYVATPALEGSPAFSPDGHWVAYASTESGNPEVYVQSYPLGAGKWQVSDGLGLRPEWTRGGAEIVFRTDKGLSAVSVDRRSGTFRPAKAQPLFAGSFLGDLQGVSLAGSVFEDYDAARDGGHFVMFVGSEGTEAAWVNLVSGWFGELRRLTAAGSQR